MAVTSCRVVMAMPGTDMATVTGTFENYNTDISNIGNLKTTGGLVYPYSKAKGDLSQNGYNLDGNTALTTSGDADYTFFSSEVSKKDLTFENTPVIKWSSSDNQTTVGLWMSFVDDYPLEARVTWYEDASFTTVAEQITYYPSSLYLYCAHWVTEYKSIKVEFLKTRLPKQYIKIGCIASGLHWVFEKDLIEASITEERDSTGGTLPSGTLEFSIHDADDNFNMTNTVGIWKKLDTVKSITATEFVDDVTVPMGTFFFDSFENSDDVVKFKSYDILGELDKDDFMGGIYSNALATDIIKAIVKDTFVESTTDIDTAFNDVRLSGYLPIMTKKEALQQICFSIGGLATPERDGRLHIQEPDMNADTLITTDRKFTDGSSVDLYEYVSGVSITYRVPKYTSTEETLVEETLTPGIYTFKFSESWGQTVTGATIYNPTEGSGLKGQGDNYMVISVASEGTVTIKGKKIEYDEVTVSKALDEPESINEKAFGKIYLCNIDCLHKQLNTLLDFYQNRQKISFEFLCGEEQTGDWVMIQDSKNTSIFSSTHIDSMTIDLTSGYTAKAECRGFTKNATSNSQMGNDELIMGNDLI